MERGVALRPEPGTRFPGSAQRALQNLLVSTLCVRAPPRSRSGRGQDLTQGFFLHLLEHKTLGRADPLKGKFRSFLLGSLQNYLSTEAERARCLKRGGGVEFIPLDLQNAENRYRLEPIDTLTPEKVFAARWAVALLGEAMNRLRREYATPKKAATLEVLKAFLDVDNSKAPPSYEEAAATLQVSVGAVKTMIHRLRKQYAAAGARGG